MSVQRNKKSNIDLKRNFGFFDYSHAPALDLPDFFETLLRNGSIQLPPAAGYDVVSTEYDRSPWAKFWDRNEQPLIEEILQGLNRAQAALDIGSGTGRYTDVLSRYARNVIGVDASEGMVRIARGKFEHAEYVRRDIWDYLKSAPKFDLILCARVLSHISGAISLVETLVDQHLRDGGTIIISDLHPRHTYTVTSFEVGGYRINLDTFKHNVQDLMIRRDIVEWKLVEVDFHRLLWKPSPHRFSTIGPNSDRPIFYVLVGRRKSP